MTSPVEKHFQGRTADTADLSTTLRSGRDDKGEDGASSNSRCGTGAVFIALGGPEAHDSSGRMTKGRIVAFPGSCDWLGPAQGLRTRACGIPHLAKNERDAG